MARWPPFLIHLSSPPVLLIAFLSGVPHTIVAQLSEEEVNSLSDDQFAQLLSHNLARENSRPNETVFSFDEFQDMAEVGCQERLLWLFNTTLTLQESIAKYHEDVLGLAGLYLKFMDKFPLENSWVWVIATAQERVVLMMNKFWAKMTALSLDQHVCVLKPVREALLEAVTEWKDLHAVFGEKQWGVLAFGKYQDTGNSKDNVLEGTMWIASVGEWFSLFAQKLIKTLQSLEATVLDVSDGGAIRHHQDEEGSFITYEFLRRKVFRQWAIDKGLVRALVRHVWKPPLGPGPPMSIGDFGAGGGHYSEWMNETGMVHAFAFDGTRHASKLTNGAVQEINFVEDLTLWRTFDWVLCLEVGEHVPKKFASTLLRNIKKHAKKGLVISWSDDWEGIGHVNCLSRVDFISTVQEQTGFVLDEAATDHVKAGCEIDYIARTVAVFKAPGTAA